MMNQFKPEGHELPQHGLILLQCLIWGLFFLFALRFWYLQIHKGEEFAQKARENQLRQEATLAPRGLIRDRHGVLVAINEPAYALGLIREDVQDITKTLDAVAGWTQIDRKELEKTYQQKKKGVKPFQPVILIPQLSFELLATIEANALFWPGLEVIVRSRRSYPQKELLAHVLGYVAEANEDEIAQESGLSMGDFVGKGGLELVKKEHLRGTKGLRQLEVDATGRRLNEQLIRLPVAGQDLQLSIDLELQAYATKQLKGQAGAIIVMDPDTGHILAFVSEPAYDVNLFVDGLSQLKWDALRNHPRHPLQNRLLQGLYPPGSVFKLVTGGAALEHGIDPEETVRCDGQLQLGTRIFRCWKKGGHGRVNYRQAQIHSCDVYFYQLGDRLGVDVMGDFARACGFGEKTGIDLPHERSGLVPTRAWKKKRFNTEWVGGDNLNMVIGQGFNLVTPLQVARFVSALVNGGTLYKPLLLLTDQPQKQGSLPMSEANRLLITQTMVETVRTGTARRLFRRDARIGGKTGTAQVVRLRLRDGDERRTLEEMPYEERDHGWIASFGEKEGKRYVAVCLVEHGGHGSSAAGPVLKEIYAWLFDRGK